MDLPYPTLKDDQLVLKLSPSNNRGSLVIRDSRKNIPTAQNIDKGDRLKITNMIQQDSAFELDQLIDENVISLLAEVGREGSQETLLHLCCQENAVKCIQYLCKRYYQDFPNEYERWVNLQTKEGLSAIMVCTLTQSHSALEYLLNMGGVDIHLIDVNKLSAYQMALNCKNQRALKLLMEYENRSKRQRTVNTAELSKEIVLVKGKGGWCESLYKCLLDCLTCGGQRTAPRKKLKKVSLLVSGKTGIDGLFMDKVDLGFEQEQLGVDFQWRLMDQFLEDGKDNRIFCNFSPYDMEDLNIPLNNYLTLCQSLSQTPWLVRRIISKPRGTNYSLNLYQKHAAKTVSTDGYLPFVLRMNSPLFLSDRKQGWPMLLQKGLAKLFGSYKKLNSLEAKQLIQTVTGWPALTINSNSEQFYQLLKWFFKDKYMFVLEGRSESHLTPPQGGVATFTVLNFYEKEGKKLVLINCPFVDAAWMEKEKHQTRALKVLRGYYNCREQMTIWVEAERLSQFFSQAIVVPLREGFQRESLQVSVSHRLFFKLELEEEEGDVIFYIADAETGRLIMPVDLQAWRNQNQVAKIQKGFFTNQGLQQLQGRSGEYFFTMNSGRGRFMIVSWASKIAKMEPLEQTFGLLQWTSCFRKNLYGRWDDSKEYVVEQTANCSVLVFRSAALRCTAKLNYSGMEILEGRLVDQNEVEMVKEEGFFYMVVKGEINGTPAFSQL